MSLFGIVTKDRFDYVVTGDPTIDVNPGYLGATWLNITTGEIFVCKDFYTDQNIWYGQMGTVVSIGAPSQTGIIYDFNFFDRRCFIDGSIFDVDHMLEFTTTDVTAIEGGGIYVGGTGGIGVQTSHYIGNLKFARNFTFEAWVAPQASGSTSFTESTSGTGALSSAYTKHYIFAPENGSNTDYGGTTSHAGMGLSVATNEIVVLEHTASYFPCLAEYTGAVSSSIFNMVTVTCTAGQYKIYLNNSLVRTGQTTSSSRYARPSFNRFGGNLYSDTYPDLNLAAVTFYDYAMGTTEINDNYNRRNSVFNP